VVRRPILSYTARHARSSEPGGSYLSSRSTASAECALQDAKPPSSGALRFGCFCLAQHRTLKTHKGRGQASNFTVGALLGNGTAILPLRKIVSGLGQSCHWPAEDPGHGMVNTRPATQVRRTLPDIGADRRAEGHSAAPMSLLASRAAIAFDGLHEPGY
jgi:hypothetical protein